MITNVMTNTGDAVAAGGVGAAGGAGAGAAGGGAGGALHPGRGRLQGAARAPDAVPMHLSVHAEARWVCSSGAVARVGITPHNGLDAAQMPPLACCCARGVLDCALTSCGSLSETLTPTKAGVFWAVGGGAVRAGRAGRPQPGNEPAVRDRRRPAAVHLLRTGGVRAALRAARQPHSHCAPRRAGVSAVLWCG